MARWLSVTPLQKSVGVMDTSHTTFVGNSGDREILRQLALAKSLKERAKWRKAIAIYQQLAGSQSDAIVAWDSQVYWPVQRFCLARLARMPQPAVRIYREMFDPVAERLMAEAHEKDDLTLVKRIVREFPLTSYGPPATDQLVEDAFDRGQFQECLNIWQSLAQVRPQQPFSHIYGPIKLAACYRKLGRETEFRKVLALLNSLSLAGPVRLGGKALTRNAVVRELQNLKPNPPEFPGSWPTYLGNHHRSRILSQPVSVEGFLWSTPLSEKEQTAGAQHPGTKVPIVFPATDGKTVYFQTGRKVQARDLNNGTLKWKYDLDELEDWGREGIAQPGWPGLAFQDPEMVEVQAGRVYVNLRGGNAGAAGGAGTLICLNASDGKRVWSRGGGGDTEELIAKSRFTGAPLVYRGRAITGAVTLDGTPESHLFCFDAETGRLLWKRFLCQGRFIEGRSPPRGCLVPGGVPSAVGNTILYATNLGVVAAVNLETGRLEWTAKYNRRESSLSQFGAFASGFQKSRAWQTNAPVIAGGAVLFTPSDSDDLLCYDGFTGALRWARRRDDARYMLGVANGRVYVSGNRVSCYTIKDGSVHSRSLEFPGRPAGRGLLGQSFVYCPTDKQLNRVFTDNGKLGHARPWDKDRGPGNMIQAGPFLVIAGNRALEVYSGQKRYQQQQEYVRAHPRDALGRLELGTLALDQNDLLNAILNLRTAMLQTEPDQVVGGRHIHEETRKLLHLAYSRLAFISQEAGEAKAAESAASKAIEVAPEGRPKFQAILDLARLRVAQKQWTEAVAMFQTVLDKYGTMRIRNGDVNISARLVAREQIGQMLQAHGRALYREQERQAQELFRRAEEQDWQRRCREVIWRYPNSRTALEALVVLGTAFLQENRPLESLRYWLPLAECDSAPHRRLAHAHLVYAFALLGEPAEAHRHLGALEVADNQPILVLNQKIQLSELAALAGDIESETKPVQEPSSAKPPFQIAWQLARSELSALDLSTSFGEAANIALAGKYLLLAGVGGIECIDTDSGLLVGHQERRENNGQGWLGIQMIPDEQFILRKVQRIIDLPARRAGLKPGDVIVQVGGKLVDGAINSLASVIQSSPQNRPLPMLIRRDGRQFSLNVTLLTRPKKVGLVSAFENRAIFWTGNELFALDAAKPNRLLWTKTSSDFREQFQNRVIIRGRIRGNIRILQRGMPAGASPVNVAPFSYSLGHLVANFGQKRLKLIDLRDGSYSWEIVADPEDELVGPAAVKEQTILIHERRHGGGLRLTARSLWEGNSLYDLERLGTSSAPWASVVFPDARTLCLLSNNRLECRQIETAKLVWAQPLAIEPQRLLMKGRCLVAVSNRGTIYSIRPSTGKVLWQRDLKLEQAQLSQVVLGDRYLACTSTDGKFHVLEIADGHVIPLDSKEASTKDPTRPLLVSGDTVFFFQSYIPEENNVDFVEGTQLSVLDAAERRKLQDIRLPGALQFSQLTGSTLVVVTREGVFGLKTETGVKPNIH